MLLDNTHSIETPEGTSLSLHPAGVVVRIFAYGIDLLIKTVFITVLSIVLGVMGGLGSGVALVIFFLTQWFYPVYFEVWHQGQTPGKKRAGLRVVHDDGTPVGFAASLIRNLLRAVDFLPFFYVAAMVAIIFSRDFKRLGDLAAGTLVIYGHQPLRPPEPNELGKYPVPPDFSTEEQRALLAFAERSRVLSPDRQNELAGVLQPLLPDGDPATRVRQMANSIVGRP